MFKKYETWTLAEPLHYLESVMSMKVVLQVLAVNILVCNVFKMTDIGVAGYYMHKFC